MRNKRPYRYCTQGLMILLSLVFFSDILTAQMDDSGIAKNFRWRNVGPANMSGRVTDIEALDSDFSHVLVAAASGGIFKSINAGTTWEPIFDTYETSSIGDIALDQRNPDIIWVGTGEANVRNSINWGNGVYKSTDGGDTFQLMGLETTHHIGRVIIDHDNSDVVYVAAQGHLWGYSGDRGMFKTENGGRTWRKLTDGLPDDGKTGATDLIMDPDNPDVLYVAMWERIRRPYNFESGGPNGGIFKTENGGRSWRKLTNGLPEGDTGRIGLAISRSNPQVVMAIVEHGFQPRQREEGEDNPDYTDMTKLGTGVYRSEDGGRSWDYMNRYNNRPFYYSQIRINPVDDQRVYLVTGSFQMSDDGGRTIRRGAQGIHVDHHAMWLDPTNQDRFYIGNDGGAYITHDHGERFDFFDNMTISQFYAIGVDMRDPYFVYGGLQDNGTWGGPSNSRDGGGIFTDHWASIGGGDGFYAQIDPEDWRIVYLESQGGNIRRVNKETRESATIRPNRQNIVNWDEYITEEAIKKNEEAGYGSGNPFRFNWNSPILLSPHNPKTVYFGGNHLFKSVNRGDMWKIISPDLSTQDPVRMNRETGGLTRDVTGAETNTAIVTISESHIKPGLLWAGTDDGLIHVTRNDGITWKNVRNNIRGVPEGIWVSRIEASHFDEGTAYVTFDGHRSDNFEPWIYKTVNYGDSWTKITGGLESGQVARVIREDIRNKNLLFLGTETAMFMSQNGGQTWERFMNNLPTAPVHDILIHSRENDLVIGTHGRGIWINDDITPLQQVTPEILASDAHLFEPKRATTWRNVSRGGSRGHKYFSGQNPPRGAKIAYFLGAGATDAQLEISDISGSMIRTIDLPTERGLNRFTWNLMFDAPVLTAEEERLVSDYQEAEGSQERNEIMEQLQDSLDKRGVMIGGINRRTGELTGPSAALGIYRITLRAGGMTMTKTLEVREDPIMK
ncbi:hypothetical protein ACFL6I_01495 [candidate division KSB1 bacterium]